MKKISKLQDEIKKILEQSDKSKDCDLHVYYYVLIGRKLDPNKITVAQQLRMIADGEIPSFDSVTRCRRKLQENHKELRGKKWYARHIAEEKVIDDVNSIK